jgi:hypothetical protein
MYIKKLNVFCGERGEERPCKIEMGGRCAVAYLNLVPLCLGRPILTWYPFTKAYLNLVPMRQGISELGAHAPRSILTWCPCAEVYLNLVPMRRGLS